MIGMTREAVWELLQKHEAVIRQEMRKHVPKHRRTKSELDEIYSDVVIDRAHDIMRLFDTKYGVLPITYLCANVRWYTFKLMHGKCYKPIPVPMSDALHPGSLVANPDLEPSLRVSSLLEALPPDLAKLLQWHVMEGFTFREIATYLKCSPDEVSRKYSVALNAAQVLLEEDDDG